MNVLLVDDDDDLRLVAEVALRDVAGWEVCSTASGREAIDAARSEVFDVVLLDVRMPELDGPATLRRLREVRGTATCPIIFITADVHENEVARLTAGGIDAVITKPFDPLQLPIRIERLVADRA